MPSEPTEIAGLPHSSEVNEVDDPWLVATKPRNITGLRRSVVRVHMQQIYYKNMATASVYIDKLGRVVKSVSSGHSSFFSRSLIEAEHAIVLAGDFVDLTLSYGHSNYSHFLLDRIPRLMFYNSRHSPLKLMVDSDTLGWTQQILPLIKISVELQPIHMNTLYYIESVSAFSRAQHPAALGHEGYLAFLRSFAAGLGTGTRRRLVIHRDIGKRGVANQEEFYETLTARGFEIIRLEALTIHDQISLFKQAECIVGVHGAGLSNLVFCAPQTVVIEILPLAYYIISYVTISKKSSLNYLPYIEPGERNRALAINNQYSDTEINIARWTKFIDRCLKEVRT